MMINLKKQNADLARVGKSYFYSITSFLFVINAAVLTYYWSGWLSILFVFGLITFGICVLGDTWNYIALLKEDFPDEEQICND